MRDIPVDWEALEDAFENNAPEVHSYLHLVSGEVLRVVDGIADPEMHSRIASDTTYMRIEPVSSREQYRWMERFIPMVEEGELRDQLSAAIDGKGAFRRFKDVLLNYPTERERWFSYRGELLHWAIKKWMEKEQLTPKEAAPWGEPKEPVEDDVQLERPTTAGEGPGELLRRQAKELIELVPAVELPAAIAFLDFLRERGVAELGRVRTIPVKRTAA